MNPWQYYTGMGLPIIPLCSANHQGMTSGHRERCKAPGKMPLIRGWQQHKETSLDQAMEWLQTWPTANIGLPLGANSGYVGVDIDGSEGEQIFQQMSRGDIPETWEYTTGAGRRLLYTIPVGMKTKKVKQAGKGTHQECAIMCNGQQTVLPPSKHHTGRVYEWCAGKSPEDIDCAMAPQWMIDLIRLEDRPAMTFNLATPKKIEPINPLDPVRLREEFTPSGMSDFDHNIPGVTVPPSGVLPPPKQEEEISEALLVNSIPEGQRDNTMTKIIGSFMAKMRGLGKQTILNVSLMHNEKFCVPPLPEEAIIQKVDHLWELEEVKTQQYKDAKESRKGFNPMDIAQAALNLLEAEGYCIKLQAGGGIIWHCKKDKGPWQPMDMKSGELHSLIMPAVVNPQYGGDGKWATRQKLGDVAHALGILLQTQGRTWNVDTGSIDTQSIDNCKYIPLGDGQLLDWRTGELSPWDPETNYTYTIPVDYDPEAKCPNWQKYLKDWLPDEGSRLIVQEFIGYALIPYMGFEKALLIQGGGANGKSLFLETIQGMLGYQITGSNNMGTIFSTFGTQYLFGKILNICNEAGSDYLKGSKSDDFKNLVSGGRVVANVKNQAHRIFNNTAKFVFSSNHDVKTTDKSDGWLRRLLIVPFDQCFLDSKVPKYEIMDALAQEYAGIFNWAIEGLQRLMEAKEFSHSEVAEERKQAYVSDNDIAADFFSNCMRYIPLKDIDDDKRWGTPTTNVKDLFIMWTEYRESSIQKHNKYLNDYMAKQKGFKKERSKYLWDSNKKQTMCWVQVKMDIKDPEFLEYLTDSGTQELRSYAIGRLKEYDEKVI